MTTEFDHIDRAFEQFYKLVDRLITINNSLVIQKNLQGKSMIQIVDETRISKGKVHYLIIDWKNKMSVSAPDEIRDFTVLVRKSNMSIEQCAQGFRMINILKNLGIQEMMRLLMLVMIIISEAVNTMNFPHLYMTSI
jgi:hypothetical protein